MRESFDNICPKLTSKAKQPQNFSHTFSSEFMFMFIGGGTFRFISLKHSIFPSDILARFHAFVVGLLKVETRFRDS